MSSPGSRVCRACLASGSPRANRPKCWHRIKRRHPMTTIISLLATAAILIRPATDTDLPAILELLAINHLPADGLAAHIHTAFIAHQAGQCVGSGALEIYGQAALLRSVAVAPALQRQGLGQRLIDAALLLARS